MKSLNKLSLALFLLAQLNQITNRSQAQPADNVAAQRVAYKVGFLGAPSFPEAENPALRMKWDDANMQRMKDLGFNTMQLNIARAYRPYDEALNLEDVVTLPERFKRAPVDLEHVADGLRTPEKIAARSAILKERIALCKKYGMHTIFHFGAPNNNQREMEPLEQGGKTVWSNGAYVSGVAGISGVRVNADRIDINAGSGTYRFQGLGGGL